MGYGNLQEIPPVTAAVAGRSCTCVFHPRGLSVCRSGRDQLENICPAAVRMRSQLHRSRAAYADG